MIKVADHPSDLEKIFQLRYEVLRKPWNQPYTSAIDDLDKVSTNVFIEENNSCIACGRLDIIEVGIGQIRYMAVHPDHRNKKLGYQILNYLEELAKAKGVQKIILHARENAVSFYLKNGYTLMEKSHVLFGVIQHYLMEKSLKQIR